MTALALNIKTFLRYPSTRAVIYVASLICLAILSFRGLEELQFEVDDYHYIIHSARISEDVSALLAPGYTAGRPLVSIAFWLTYELWQDWVPPYHYLVFLAHILAALLLVPLARAVGLSWTVSLVAGLLFVVGVAPFRSVYYVSGLAYPLSLCLGLTAATLLLRPSPGVGTQLAAGAALVAGTCAHASVVLIVPLCMLHIFRREGVLARKHLLVCGLIEVAAVGVALVLALAYPDTVQSYQSLHLQPPLVIISQVCWMASRLVTTAFWVPLPIYAAQPWELAFGAVLVLVAGYGVVRGPRGVSFWFLWVLASLVLFANRPARALTADPSGPSRYLYLANAGAVVLWSWAASRASELSSHRIGRQAAMVCLGVGVLATCVSGIRSYRALQSFSYYSAGSFLLRSGKPGQALNQIDRALQYRPEILPMQEVYETAVEALVLQGGTGAPRLSEGLKRFPNNSRLRGYEQAEALLRQAPDHQRPPAEERERDALAHALLTYGRGSAAVEDYDAAEKTLLSVLHVAADPYPAHMELGKLYGNQQRFVQAAEQFRLALKAREGDVDARLDLGKAYFSGGLRVEAVAVLKDLVADNPDLVKPRYLLGVYQIQAGNFAEGARDLERALPRTLRSSGSFDLGLASYELQPFELISALVNLGAARAATGDHTGALEAYQKALRFAPEDPTINARLALLYLLTKDEGLACAQYNQVQTLSPSTAGEIAHFFRGACPD